MKRHRFSGGKLNGSFDLVNLGKSYGVTEFGDLSYSYDAMDIINDIKALQPMTTYFHIWHEDYALGHKANFEALEQDPWIITRDEVDYNSVPTPTPVPGVTIYEAENLAASISTGDTRITFADTNLSNGNGDKLDGNAINDYITYTVNVPTAGAHNIKIKSKNAPIRAKAQMQIDVAGTWVNQGPEIDYYSATDTYSAEYDLGSYTFASSGNKSFRFLITGKNASSTDYTLGFDYIKLTP